MTMDCLPWRSRSAQGLRPDAPALRLTPRWCPAPAGTNGKSVSAGLRAGRPHAPDFRPAPRPQISAQRFAPQYAALDLGTNNCRLLVARPAGSGFRVVDAFSRIVRLGEGLAASGVLSEDAMARALDALKICADKIAGRRVAAGRYVATEACRQAANCEAFLARVREEIGIEIEIISSTEEARLVVAGCAPLLNPRIPYAIVFDIGGGSTEIVWLRLWGGGHRRAARDPRLDVASVWRGHPDRSVRRHRSFAGDLPRNGRRGGGGIGAVRAQPTTSSAMSEPAECRCSAARGR